jgi:hypothetical protein
MNRSFSLVLALVAVALYILSLWLPASPAFNELRASSGNELCGYITDAPPPEPCPSAAWTGWEFLQDLWARRSGNLFLWIHGSGDVLLLLLPFLLFARRGIPAQFWQPAVGGGVAIVTTAIGGTLFLMQFMATFAMGAEAVWGIASHIAWAAARLCWGGAILVEMMRPTYPTPYLIDGFTLALNRRVGRLPQ